MSIKAVIIPLLFLLIKKQTLKKRPFSGRFLNYLLFLIVACASAKRAIGTKYGEQET